MILNESSRLTESDRYLYHSVPYNRLARSVNSDRLDSQSKYIYGGKNPSKLKTVYGFLPP